MLRWGVWLAAVLVCIGAVAGCRKEPTSTAARGLRVVVTVAPLRGLVEPLLPEGSTATVLMQPGKSEHGYEFSPSDLAKLAEADLVVYVGLGLEGKVESVLKSHPRPTRHEVCFADAVGIKAEETHDDHEGHEEHDEHEGHHNHGVDPHLWLDPVLVRELVPHLKRAVGLAEFDRGAYPVEDTRLDDAAAKLQARVAEVDREWRVGIAGVSGRPVVTHHNAFGRPAARYGFRVAAVIREFETSEPSPGDIAKVVGAIKEQKVGVIFVEPQFSQGVAARIGELSGVKVATLDPLGNGDWFALMRSNLESLVKNLSDGADGSGGAK